MPNGAGMRMPSPLITPPLNLSLTLLRFGITKLAVMHRRVMLSWLLKTCNSRSASIRANIKKLAKTDSDFDGIRDSGDFQAVN